jgi:hypothetical protein
MDENEYRVIGLTVPELSRRSLEMKGQILQSPSCTLLSIFEPGTFRIRRRAATPSTGMFVVCTYYEECPESRDTKVLNMYNISLFIN